MSKEKDENTSVESSERKKRTKRLDGMLESMNSRSDPVSTHRIATEYFQSFKIQRNIKEDSPNILHSTAVTTAVTTAQPTADGINNNVPKKTHNQHIDLLHTVSEEKVYNAIRTEVRNSSSEATRIGLTKLKELTGLSDKTIRVAIHTLNKKKSIRIERSSIGIYGRMFSVLETDEILRERNKEAVIIDKTTKSILLR